MEIVVAITILVIGAAIVVFGAHFLIRGVRRHHFLPVLGGLLLVWFGASLVAVGVFTGREGGTGRVTRFVDETPATGNQP